MRYRHEKNSFDFPVGVAAVLCPCRLRRGRHCKNRLCGQRGFDSWSGRFQSYHGSETKRVTVPKGMDLFVTYKLAAESGDLRVTVENPKGMVYVDTEQVKEGTITVAHEGGKYLLRVVGEDAKNGSFELKWELNEQE